MFWKVWMVDREKKRSSSGAVAHKTLLETDRERNVQRQREREIVAEPEGEKGS